MLLLPRFFIERFVNLMRRILPIGIILFSLGFIYLKSESRLASLSNNNKSNKIQYQFNHNLNVSSYLQAFDLEIVEVEENEHIGIAASNFDNYLGIDDDLFAFSVLELSKIRQNNKEIHIKPQIPRYILIGSCKGSFI